MDLNNSSSYYDNQTALYPNYSTLSNLSNSYGGPGTVIPYKGFSRKSLSYGWGFLTIVILSLIGNIAVIYFMLKQRKKVSAGAVSIIF